MTQTEDRAACAASVETGALSKNLQEMAGLLAPHFVRRETRSNAGTAGRIENTIVAVYSSYASSAGHALIDRELYVQQAWFADRERMAAAGFEPGHAFATKPQIAKAQAERPLDAGLPPRWGTGDEVYGRSGELRTLFEERSIGYVFAIGCDFIITTSGRQQMRADQALGLVSPSGWNRRSAGYIATYALLPVTAALVRANHPAPVLPDDADQAPPADCGMIALTVPELQRLLPILLPAQVSRASGIDFHLWWSNWRRRHQVRARWHHYQRRFAPAA